ncbi:MAG: exosome complex RNA-binding protein Csl4 [Candidatus Altiarchaeota archaeon]|nr:exosome complex RNA-binding protein Csl4 [Candidatus Altiarchaeota archaeon]
MKMENKDLIGIGDYLGTIEEFMPGEGTYAENGKIYASNTGKAILDREKHIARVEGKFPPTLKEGQIVFGEVLDMRKNSVIVITRKLQGSEGEVDVRTGIFISNIADTYVEKPGDAFAIGDIVKGRVVKVDAGLVEISTKGEFGAVKAFCRRCRTPLIKSPESQDLLLCPCCKNKEKRKIAADYGNVAEL